MRARYGDLRAAAFFAHANAQHAQLVALAVALAQHLFLARHRRFRAAKLQNHGATAYGLHSAMDDLAFAFRIFLVLRVAFSFLQLLQHQLLGGLGCNASKIGRRRINFYEIAKLRKRVKLAGDFERGFRAVVQYFFNNFLLGKYDGLAAIHVNRCIDFLGGGCV